MMSLYDRDDYYRDNPLSSRLSRSFEPLMGFTDRLNGSRMYRLIKKDTGRVLDIGAGVGRFLHQLRQRGLEVHGTTLSEASRQAAARLYGIRIENCETFPQTCRDLRFDLISYWHVFEHLTRPEEHLVRLRYLLAERGLVLIEVPNPESLGAGLSFVAWLGSDPEHHPNLRTRADLERMLNSHGLRIVSQGSFSLKFTYVFIWSALLGRLLARSYDFNRIMAILRSPGRALLKDPARTAFACLSLALFVPAVLFMAALGIARRRGEVIRLLARRAPASDPEGSSSSTGGARILARRAG